MVDVPFAGAYTVVLPRHAWLKERFQVVTERGHGWETKDGGEFFVPPGPAVIEQAQHLRPGLTQYFLVFVTVVGGFTLGIEGIALGVGHTVEPALAVDV